MFCPWKMGDSAGSKVTQQLMGAEISCLEIGPVVVQQHGHLTLTFDDQGQILKMLYLRNGRAD